MHSRPISPSLARVARHGAAVLALSAAALAGHAQTVFSAAGASQSSIQTSVDSFRTALGTLNANNGSSFNSGRREINWDGVPDSASDPNAFPGDFFGQAFTGANGGRARGIQFSTPTGGFLNSANVPGPVSSRSLFNVQLANSGISLTPFSGDQVFIAQNSTITDVTFTVAGTSSSAAFVRGFGAVFLDVETTNATFFEFFNTSGASLGTFSAPVSGAGGFSFLGVAFDNATAIGRVRITSGSEALGAFADGSNLRQTTGDFVAMDDFIYSEPISVSAVPEPSTYAAIFGALALTGVMVQRRRRAAAATPPAQG
ncbi:MAG: PEP-CTERM sorting domain-containing protein [Opitutae bacterium]|nr:PEP-CTERM sorting domain-containing protein [Opitutae bacterium]